MVAKVQSFRQAYQQRKVVRQDVKALRRSSPELDSIYRTTIKAARKENRGLKVFGAGVLLLGATNAITAAAQFVNAGVLLLGATNAITAAAQFVNGDPVMGTIFATGAVYGVAGGPQIIGQARNVEHRKAEQAVVRHLLGSTSLRQQYGSMLRAPTLKAYSDTLRTDQQYLGKSIQASKKSTATKIQQSRENRRLLRHANTLMGNP